MTTLQALRIHGPITLADFAKRLGQPEASVDWQLWSLKNLGLAVQPARSSGTWDLTSAGRAYVDRHEVDVRRERRIA